MVQGLRFYLVPGPGTPARPAQWTTDPGGTTHLNGVTFKTNGSQSYGDDVLLGDDATVDAGANVSFGGRPPSG